MIIMLCPPEIHYLELLQKIKADINLEEFLFARTSCDEFNEECWEMHCTACDNTFFESKSKRLKDFYKCPVCGCEIIPKRWNETKQIKKQHFTYYLFQRGNSSDIWIRAYEVIRSIYGDLDFREYARYYFDYGIAKRWNFDFKGDLYQVKAIKTKYLYKGFYNMSLENYIGSIDIETIKGSCLEYSQLNKAIQVLNDPIAYLDLYIKNPLLEMLWKFNLPHLFLFKIGFSKTVNMKAKNIKDLFFGLGIQDVANIRSINNAEEFKIYKNLRLKYNFPANDEVCQYAKSIFRHDCKSIMFYREKTFKYLKKQSKNNQAYDNVAIYRDYLNELNELQIENSDYYPSDLFESHQRLSLRITAMKTAKHNSQFRIKRKLLKKYCFKYNKMFIRPISSETELIKEGEQQHHCVARYSDSHIKSDKAIFVLRNQNEPLKPFYTIEFDTKKLVLLQCYGLRNCLPTNKVKDFINHWENYLKECI